MALIRKLYRCPPKRPPASWYHDPLKSGCADAQPDFNVSTPLDEAPADSCGQRGQGVRRPMMTTATPGQVTLGFSKGLRVAVEEAAHREEASLNSWPVRATAAATQGVITAAARDAC
ncbi:hypothetical protein [Mycobacterium uberis]|uniref:hypothetical protein n=1 Tax=Mycobacterium uberis TaxID=2162698 RepID=UPI00140306AD|nr:hypothetical protein [Mycobacterium uberis]